MPKNYDNTDLLWTTRGDIVLGHDGDIMDTFYDPLRSVVQECRTRLKGDLGDWLFHQDICAAISDYVGEPNNKVTAESIKTRIRVALSKYGLIMNEDMKIVYVPIDIDKIMFRISLSVASTARNVGSNEILIQFLYSYAENNVYIVTGR